MLRLLCTAEFDDGWTERFGKLVEIDRVGFSLDKDPDKRMGKEQIIKALQGYDIHISGYEKLSEEVLYQCPDLKLILSVRGYRYYSAAGAVNVRCQNLHFWQ